jgi:hypothetical protein
MANYKIWVTRLWRNIISEYFCLFTRSKGRWLAVDFRAIMLLSLVKKGWKVCFSKSYTYQCFLGESLKSNMEREKEDAIFSPIVGLHKLSVRSCEWKQELKIEAKCRWFTYYLVHSRKTMCEISCNWFFSFPFFEYEWMVYIY